MRTLARYRPVDTLVAETTFTYDDALRLTNLSHDKGMNTLADYSWTYDAAGRLTSVTNVDGTDDYTYDDNGQLTDVDSDYQTDEAYTYDANGNRTNTGYTTGSNNQLTSDGTYNYTYDDSGNRTKKTSISTGDYVEYEWDHRNRLTTVTFRNSSDVKQKEVSYTYDVFDRRIAKHVDTDGNGTVDSGESYVYDGLSLADIVLVFDDSDALMERLLYGPGVDQPLAAEDSSGDVTWLLADHQGTIRDVVEYDDANDTTTVVNHLQYSSFGQITSQTDSSYEPRHTYTGREWDAEVDLYYYRARWYDAAVGRFISEDPIGFAGLDENTSRFVGNSPANFVDATGRTSTPNDKGSWRPTATDIARVTFRHNSHLSWLVNAFGMIMRPRNGNSNVMHISDANVGYFHVYASTDWNDLNKGGGVIATVTYHKDDLESKLLAQLMAENIERGIIVEEIESITEYAVANGFEFAIRTVFSPVDIGASFIEFVKEPNLMTAVATVPGIMKGASLIKAAKPVKLLGAADSPAVDAAKLTKLADKAADAVPSGGVLRSSNELNSVERATPELLDAIRSKDRTITIAQEGSEEARYLDFIGAEANVGGETMTHILLRQNPGKSAALEEFLHGTQARLGIIERLGTSGAERHVKDFMIRHQKLLGLGDVDVDILRQLMEAGL